MSSVEKFIHSHVQAWCKHLAGGASKVGKWSSAKNMSDWSTYLGYDIMGSLAYGKDFRCMESDEHRYVPDLMMRTAEMVYVVSRFLLMFQTLLANPGGISLGIRP